MMTVLYSAERVQQTGCTRRYLHVRHKKILPHVRKLMYGEACSNVPVFTVKSDRVPVFLKAITSWGNFRFRHIYLLELTFRVLAIDRLKMMTGTSPTSIIAKAAPDDSASLSSEASR
jgi:hypothetical protein